MEPAAIVDHVKARIGREYGDLAGVRIAVTAGGTREPADPCASSATAPPGRWATPSPRRRADRGAAVVLITSAEIATPDATEVVHVETAREMLAACRRTHRAAPC